MFPTCLFPQLNMRLLTAVTLAISALIFLFLVNPGQAYAQSTTGAGVDAALFASPTEVTVGDLFTLTLQIIHPAENRATPSQFDTEWGTFEIRNIEAMDTVPHANGQDYVTTQKVQATLWMTGTHTTPDLQVTVFDAAGNQAEYDVLPATVVVNSVLQPGDENLRDIKPQASLPYVPFWLQLLIAAVAVSLILGLLLWWLWRRRKNRPTIVEEVPVYVDPRPADVKALEALQGIAELHLPTQRRFAEHYDLVTDVLRGYLADGFKIPALDQTTSELKYSLPPNVIEGVDKVALFQLLEEADLVKFAQVEPDFALADQLTARARHLVLATAVRLRGDSPRSERNTDRNMDHAEGHSGFGLSGEAPSRVHGEGPTRTERNADGDRDLNRLEERSGFRPSGDDQEKGQERWPG